MKNGAKVVARRSGPLPKVKQKVRVEKQTLPLEGRLLGVERSYRRRGPNYGSSRYRTFSLLESHSGSPILSRVARARLALARFLLPRLGIIGQRRIYKRLRRETGGHLEDLLGCGAGLLHLAHIGVGKREPGRGKRRFGAARAGALKRRDRLFVSPNRIVGETLHAQDFGACVWAEADTPLDQREPFFRSSRINQGPPQKRH